MIANTMTSIRVELIINDLGQIPEYHQDDPTIGVKALAYFDDGVCDASLAKQVAHFGKSHVTRMLRGELQSWLEDLGTSPRIASITIVN